VCTGNMCGCFEAENIKSSATDPIDMDTLPKCEKYCRSEVIPTHYHHTSK